MKTSCSLIVTAVQLNSHVLLFRKIVLEISVVIQRNKLGNSNRAAPSLGGRQLSWWMPLCYFQDNSQVTCQNFLLFIEVSNVSSNLRDNIILLMNACYSNEGHSQFIRKCVNYWGRIPL